jgi:hypothetical protein
MSSRESRPASRRSAATSARSVPISAACSAATARSSETRAVSSAFRAASSSYDGCSGCGIPEPNHDHKADASTGTPQINRGRDWLPPHLVLIRRLDHVQGLLTVTHRAAEDDKTIVDQLSHECCVLKSRLPEYQRHLRGIRASRAVLCRALAEKC